MLSENHWTWPPCSKGAMTPLGRHVGGTCPQQNSLQANTLLYIQQSWSDSIQQMSKCHCAQDLAIQLSSQEKLSEYRGSWNSNKTTIQHETYYQPLLRCPHCIPSSYSIMIGPWNAISRICLAKHPQEKDMQNAQIIDTGCIASKFTISVKYIKNFKTGLGKGWE